MFKIAVLNVSFVLTIAPDSHLVVSYNLAKKSCGCVYRWSV